ncbi:hypothetical protein CC78DRAFT_51288 [Lojkania enalia]|uniref:Uncharacterized protein n=1 Tax=Lojkania enalia TaxID=147567 RepID=A0A9P4K0Q3_9PLEO|nr:hypothetical protein CC78DRAFT_51288 [Didymosphaeria enalia]
MQFISKFIRSLTGDQRIILSIGFHTISFRTFEYSRGEVCSLCSRFSENFFFFFLEELGYLHVGHIVSKSSVTFASDPPISVHSNHSGMVKFGSTGDEGFSIANRQIF